MATQRGAPFSAWSIFREASVLTRNHFWQLGWLLSLALLPFEAFLLYALGGAYVSILSDAMADPSGALDHLAELGSSMPTTDSRWAGVALLLSFPFCAGFLLAALRLARGESASWRDLVAPFRRAGSFPLLLLAGPALLVFRKWGLSICAWLDEGLSPAAALRRSRDLSQGVEKSLFLLALLLATANGLGYLLPMGIGLAFTIPMTFMAVAVAYEKARRRAASVPPPLPAL